ncbi:VOC family protein [Streptomyces sp. NPDC086023]|uniref:VOC family protein n=1 Tax=Streptomyces sp. NPDC086023 TaxID=3365746 RepID=UPI0037CE1352
MLTTNHVDGAPNWVDLGTPDVAGAETFYAALFGWTFEAAGEDVGGYGTFRLGGSAVAGGTAVGDEQGPPAWTVYFRSPDADATAQAVRQGGGRVLVEPADVPDRGRTAVFADPAGAAFGIWQPRAGRGLDAVTDVGTLCWTELYTSDPAAAADFYRGVLGWDVSEVPFGGGAYSVVKPPGTPDEHAFGGLVPLGSDPVDDVPYWTPYFEVPDCDVTAARAEELGGKVRLTPEFMEGVGRFAKLADPAGARFAVIASAPPPGG